jgi:hypothetical protein
MTRRPAHFAPYFALGFIALITCTAGLAGSAAPQQTAGAAPASAARLSDADIERFLLNARVLKSRSAGKGITASLRATLTDGTLTHDAHVQTIDESKREFRSAQGVEFNFRDSWTFNVAAYRIDRLIGLNLVPVSVKRHWRSSDAAFTWWIDDVQMDEGDRLKKKVTPPNLERWNEQMQLVRLFDQLIYNVDRNLGNLIITNDWSIWAIDHTRAFRTNPTLKSPDNIARCDRKVLEKLKQLDSAVLRREVGDFLQNWEIDSLLKRRDAIVALLEQRGAAGVFDRKTQ